MNNIIKLFLLSVTLYACNSSSSKDTKPKKSKIELGYDYADIVLKYDDEKIGLLSAIKSVPREKTKSVLREYIAKTLYTRYLLIEDQDHYIKLIDTIAQSNQLPRDITASIIYSYQYEMYTKEEIVEDIIAELKEYENE